MIMAHLAIQRNDKSFMTIVSLIGAFLIFSGMPTLSIESPKVGIIDDFETGLDRNCWQGPIQLSQAHPAHGKSSLEVKFISASPSVSLQVKSGDWSGHDRLLFDVFNSESEPRILTFSLFDAVGESRADSDRFDHYWGEEKLFLGSGRTHVEVVLTNLNASSELRPLALDRIRRFTISANPNSLPLTLHFDNFRLVAGNEGSASVSKMSPEDTLTRLKGRWVSILQVGPRDKIPESDSVRLLRGEAEKEYQSLKAAIASSEIMGLDTIYSQAELVTAELGIYFRPLLAWFNNDREKEVMFRYVVQSCRRERDRLERLLTGEVRLPERDDTQTAGPLVPPYPQLHGLSMEDGFFQDAQRRPLFIISLHGPSLALQRFFATPEQHIESYSVGGGSRWTVDTSPVYEVFQKYPDSHRVGWDGWCGHLIRDLDSMGGKKENTVICLESPQIRAAVERYIEREAQQWLKNPNLLYNIMAYELQYICYCERSQQMFRAWLEKKHQNLEHLNYAWGANYKSFENIVAPPTKNARPLPGTNRAQWYDWACFNQDRFSDYLVWVKSVIRRYDQVTPLAAGGSFSMLYGGNGTSGIDEEQIINRVDDVIIHEGSGSTMGMDLQLALSEKAKPLCDPEMSLGEVRYLLPHMLHGKSVMQLWHWPDQPPNEYPHLINDSPAHGWRFPLSDVSALFRAVLDGRRLSQEIAAFPAAQAQVALLYSKTSMLQLPPEMLTWHTTPYLRELENCYEASRFLDTRITFVSEKQILDGKLAAFKILVVPAASHMRAEVVESMNRFVEQGGSLILLPSSLLSDEYNRAASYLNQWGIQVREIEQPAVDRVGELEQAYDQSFHERVVYRSTQAIELSPQPVGIFAKGALKLQAQGTRQKISIAGPHTKLAAFPDGQPALVSLPKGRGVIYYATTSFPQESLRILLDRIFDASGVDRPIRVRGDDGGWPGDVEARYASRDEGKFLYIVNFNRKAAKLRIEADGRIKPKLYELRTQVNLTDGNVTIPAGETCIYKFN